MSGVLSNIAIVNLDRKSFTFMRSIPNHIPLSQKFCAIRRADASAFDPKSTTSSE